MNEKKWEQAMDAFKESFLSMVEQGNLRAKIVLKYVILT